MPKDREKTVNPAIAHLKSEKARALKKGKAAISAQRNERLASRNPFRLERQVDDLKALQHDGGGLGARDKKQLEELERQLGMVRKAREKVGDKVPTGREVGGEGRNRGSGDGARGRGRGGSYGGLGKRARGEDGRREESSGNETDESVRRIPMPRDTPPPIPRSDRQWRGRGGYRGSTANGHGSGNANMEPLGEGREKIFHDLPAKPSAPVAAKTTYEAKAVVRDLRKEAVKAFMPSAVARKVQAAKGEPGKLLEEEEVERLEGEGYLRHGGRERGGEGDGNGDKRMARMGGVVVDAAPEVGNERSMEGMGGDGDRDRLEEEEERFRWEMEPEMEMERPERQVRMKEVSDEDL
ncbi:MAG: hypothetical protein Q9218_001386 [Villophora microphyllina]